MMTENLPPLSLGDDDDLSDRERLALAFGILRERGWYAPTEWSSTMCCTGCAWKKIREHFGYTADEWNDVPYEDEPPTIWWQSNSDSIAFVGTIGEAATTPEMRERVSAVWSELVDSHGTLEAQEHMDAWLSEHSHEIETDEIVARSTEYTALLTDLNLHWSGGPTRIKDAVDVLRSVGLIVTEPESEEQCVVVHPRLPMMRVARRADGMIGLWLGYQASSEAILPTTVLTPEAVSDLVALLRPFMEEQGEPQ